jgi:hypothetical protein
MASSLDAAPAHASTMPTHQRCARPALNAQLTVLHH